MKKKLMVCALGFGISLNCMGQEFSSELTSTVDRNSASLGYKIGNGVSYFNRRRDSEFSIEFPTVKWNLNASCSGWDAGLSVSNILDNVEGQFQKLQVEVVNSITGFVTQLPMLILQREDPGLYEMISSVIIDGEDLFNLKIQSCQAMSERFSNSDNPYGELADESFWYEFSSAFDSETKEDTDVVEVMDDADANKGEKGVVSMGGESKCGGADQPRCEPVTDVVQYGLGKLFKGALQGNDDDVYSEYGVRIKPWVAQIWADTDEASKWITDVIGNVTYATCEDCEQMEIEAGEGVYSDIADEAGVIYSILLELAESTEIPNRGVLQAMSSNEIFIDATVIEALRAEGNAREMFIRRISEDVALMKVVDKLLAARRVLLVGSADPYFQSVSMNKEIIEKKIELIADEVAMLSEELSLKKMARGDAIQTLLSRHDSRKRIGEGDQWSEREVKALKDRLERVN
ncbi:hypothetical protein BFV94_4826 [Alteromonas macleodii]|uniref:Integrating conjugative element protein n=2 Tax=Alteromonas macleodii TaxID=28108 RepID=A0AB36FRU9_ALTMA|nr:hypothetical protein BFV94_4826 [Alteromonas macleodii]OES24666.1 hypothetical protein BFV95_4692 [Alteromonas macleodii]OES24934.1 hypothetical protein BFV93_4643 [Alteromonas macleodii]OES38564.1 hypothetical protein BFV96_4851 [Alteromonas macleodii]